MSKRGIALVNFFVLLLTALLFCGTAVATGVRIVPSTPWVVAGSDFSFDVVADAIPADGLGGVQFRLNLSGPVGTVVGVADLSQAGANNIAVATPLLVSLPTATRSGIGDFFWSGRGSNGILVMDNETLALTNGSALYTFAHTNGATPPSGSGSVATFRVRLGANVPAGQLAISLSDVMFINGGATNSGAVYPLEHNYGVSVPVRCVTAVPSLLGLTLGQAQAALSSANLALGNVYEVNNPNGSLPLNVVLEQSSVAGNTTFCQTPINLAVNPPPAVTLNPVTSPTTVGNQTLSGTLAAGATIAVSVNGTATVGALTYPTATSWSCPVSNLAAGNNTVTVTATDSFGNRGTASATIDYLPLTAAMTPSHVAGDYQGSVLLNITNLSSAGSATLVEQYVDVNHNGIIDAGDYPIRSFSVTDGLSSANQNVQGDEDGVANGSVTTSLNYFLTSDLYHAPGNYLVRVTNGTNVVTAPFTVTPPATSQGISGVVTDGTNPIAGAMVRLLDKWQRTIAFAIADASGQYTVGVKNPGDYLLAPAAYGYATPAASIVPVTLAAGQNIVNNSLTLAAGTFHVAGQVKDFASGTGIAGVWVEAKGATYSGVAVTDSNGNYDLLLPGGSYAIAASADVNGPAPFAKGYAVYAKQPVSVTLTADTTGQDIALPKGTVTVSGQVLDQLGQGVAGVPVQGRIWSTIDPRDPVSLGVTDGNGNYNLGLYGADNWNIFLSDAAAQTSGYLGTIIRDYSTNTGSPSGNNLTAHPITAWVKGTVKDANGNLLADVAVKLHNADASQVAIVRTAADGTYRLGAYAGDWQVTALTADKGLYPVPERTVTLADGQSVTVDFIADVTLPALTPALLANGGFNIAYSQTVTALNGVGPYGYSILSGTLPDGLLLDPATGVLAGTPTASDVTYTFTVRATDADGLTADQPYTVTIYGVPTIQIGSPIAGISNNNKPQLIYTASVGTVVVKVDGTIVNKVSGDTLDLLSDGSHTLEIGITNSVVMTNSASVTFTIDTIPPVISAMPAAGLYDITQNVTLSTNEPAIIYYTTDGSVPTTASAVYGQPLTIAASTTLNCLAIDSAGNRSNTTYSYVIDTIPPILIVSTLADGAYTNQQVLNIAGKVTDNIGVKQLQINGILVPINSDGSFSHAVTLQNGGNTITTVATDLAGNMATDTRTINLDLTAPVLVVTKPADNSKTGIALVDVTGTVDETSTVTVKIHGSIQNAAMNGTAFTATVTLVSGLNTIEVTATDLAGNQSTQKRTVLFDDQQPSLAVTLPAQDISTNQSSFTIKGTASDPLTAVTVSITMDGQTFTPPVVNGAFAQTVSFTTEKSYAVMVTATNEVGTATSVQRNIVYDITPPALSINAVTTPTTQASQVISGTRGAGNTVTVTCATATVGSVTYPTTGTWSASITNMQAGGNTITASTSDAAGNVATVSAIINFETTPPETTFTFAVFGNKSVTMSGSFTDSYTGNPANHILGQYVNGDVGTNSLQSCSIQMSGGTEIFGKAWVGVGGNPVTGICKSGGSLVYNNNTGNLTTAKDMTPKADPGGGTLMGALNVSGGATKTLSAGNYRFTSISLSGGSSTLTIDGQVMLHIDGNLTLSGGSRIIVTTGPVTIYVNGQKMDISGGSLINNSQIPKNLIIYGTAGLQTANLSGGSSQYALVYAPTAAITLSGGQNTFGSVIGSTVNLSGGSSVHFDESLKN